MEYIQRKKSSLEDLKKTNDEFNRLRKDMSVKEAYKFYKENKSKYKYNTPETKEEFFNMTGGRCSFCTRIIMGYNSEMTVEHIQTKVSTPSKIFEWKNLLCSCRTCNNKRNEYPYDKNKYLDPTKVKDISKYFEFKMDGTIKVAKGLTKSEEEKAAYMIDMYKLNRTDLNTERKYFFRDIVNDDKYYDILKNDDKSSMRIIFLSVFTYYKRRNESNGE